MSGNSTKYSAETRAEALRLYAEGVPPRSIAARLMVRKQAVLYWIEYEQRRVKVAPEPVRRARAGSGVIAPPAYAPGRGYRWGSGL